MEVQVRSRKVHEIQPRMMLEVLGRDGVKRLGRHEAYTGFSGGLRLLGFDGSPFSLFPDSVEGKTAGRSKSSKQSSF